MLIRYNSLKIYILAGDAKPGGLIGAMLSPYLYSNNMFEFCKKFNELTKDFDSSVWISVNLFTDIVEKFYTFYIKVISFIMIIIFLFLQMQ